MKNLWGVNTHRYGLFPTEEWGMLPQPVATLTLLGR